MKKLRYLILALSFILILQGLSLVFHLDLVPRQALADSGSWQVNTDSDSCQRRITPDYFGLCTTMFLVGEYTGFPPVNKYGVGMCWTTLNIPPRATITSAKVTFTSATPLLATTVNSKIHGEASDNAATFSTEANFDGRSYTGASVNWDNIGSWVPANVTHDSPDLSGIVQKIVNRAGWASGNALVIIWEDFEGRSTDEDGRYREAYSYDSNSTGAPLLSITWTHAPLIDSASATDPTDGSWWLCYYSAYTTEVKVTDPNGVADLNYVDLKMEGPADTYTNVIIRWTEANNSFFIVAGAGYINLGSSTKSTSGNQVTLDFFFAVVSWDYPLTSDVDCQIYALDDSANTAGPTKFDLNLNIANTLTTTPTSSDYRQDVGGSVTISGTITFVGPPSNIAITNPYISANGVKIHNSAHTVMNTGSVNPYSIVITLPATVGVDTYHVYVDIALGDFVDKDIGSATGNVIRDRLEIWAKDDPEIQISAVSSSRYNDGMFALVIDVSISETPNYLVTVNSITVNFLSTSFADGSSQDINRQTSVPVGMVLRGGQHITKEAKLTTPLQKEPKSVFVEVGLAVDDSLTNFDQVRVIHKAVTLDLPSPTFIDAPSTAPSNTASDPFPILRQYPLLMPGILSAIAISSIIAFRKKRVRHYVPHRTEGSGNS